MFKNELECFHHAVDKADTILIAATEREDGDSIAAELAVKYIIEKAFPKKKKCVDIINVNRCPSRFLFLQGSEEILSFGEQRISHYDVGIVVDCGIDRSGPVRDIFNNCSTKIKIDHHSVGNEGLYNIEVCTSNVASTTEILFQFVNDPTWDIHLDPRLAELIYVGIICDTGSFQYDLTKPSTHLIASRLLQSGFDFTYTAEKVLLNRSFAMKKLLGLVLERMEKSPCGNYLYSILTQEMIRQTGAGLEDVGDIIDEMCFVNGIDVSMLFVEQPDGLTRISFRSKGRVNVGQFAMSLTPTGGGHPRASGCVLKGTMNEVIDMVCQKIAKILAGKEPG